MNSKEKKLTEHPLLAKGRYGCIYQLPHHRVMKECYFRSQHDRDVWKRDRFFLQLLHSFSVHLSPRIYSVHQQTSRGQITMDRWTMDMKQLGEKQRSHYFPWVDVPVYTYAQVQQMLMCLMQLRETGIINSDMKRDNILVRPSTQEMCVTDFGFSGDMNGEWFPCKIGWPQAYYPPASKWTPTAAQQKHWRHQFTRCWIRYPQYVDLWEWEAEMLFMGVRIWFTTELSQEAATSSSLKVFTGVGEDLLPNRIRQHFVKVNPYIQYCYQREARDHARMCPTQLYTMSQMDFTS